MAVQNPETAARLLGVDASSDAAAVAEACALKCHEVRHRILMQPLVPRLLLKRADELLQLHEAFLVLVPAQQTEEQAATLPPFEWELDAPKAWRLLKAAPSNLVVLLAISEVEIARLKLQLAKAKGAVAMAEAVYELAVAQHAYEIIWLDRTALALSMALERTDVEELLDAGIKSAEVASPVDLRAALHELGHPNHDFRHIILKLLRAPAMSDAEKALLHPLLTESLRIRNLHSIGN